MTPWLRSVWGLALVQAAACAAATAPPKFELVRFSDGILGYYPARVGERELVRHYATQAAATGLPLDERIRRVRTYLDVLLNFDTDRAEQHLQGPYSVFGSKTPGFFSLSKNWRWAAKPCPGGGLAHASADGKPHTATGVCRHIIRSGCVLRQHVYLDPAQPPSEISVGFTVPLFRYAGYKNRRCRVRWGGAPIRVRTDNTPFDFYAGPLPEKGKWVTLEVPAVDIGLGGMRRVFYGVSFQAPGGKALFGPTVFRWPELALCTSGDLGIRGFVGSAGGAH